MTSKEFVAYMKGMAIGITDIPTEEQWVLILKALMRVEEEENKGKNLITEIRTEVEKIVKPIIKKFPGAPPDIFM